MGGNEAGAAVVAHAGAAEWMASELSAEVKSTPHMVVYAASMSQLFVFQICNASRNTDLKTAAGMMMLHTCMPAHLQAKQNFV